MLVDHRVFDLVGGLDPELSVGFNDTDFCLKVRALGYRVLNHGSIVLYHHESLTRGKSVTDPHPEDSRLFKKRYGELIEQGDFFYSPLLSREDPKMSLGDIQRWNVQGKWRTSINFKLRPKND
jgi:hypothetical protein